jgi:hypothetical protein
MNVAETVAVVRPGRVTLPEVAPSGDEFTPGSFTGTVELFDAATAAPLCASPIEATNSRIVTSDRGIPNAIALTSDLYVEVTQEATRILQRIAPSLTPVP